jgi:tetratricopeptide (TPR) repeat protein
MNKALALRGMRGYGDALAAFNEPIELDPALAESWYSKAVDLARMGGYMKSISSFEGAIKLHPEVAVS